MDHKTLFPVREMGFLLHFIIPRPLAARSFILDMLMKHAICFDCR